jgi:hypothetical protein
MKETIETSGFKQRLEKAKVNKEFLKIIFQYFNANHVVVKRGYVINCYNDSFDFSEIIDGEVTYSYSYIIEIKKEVKKDDMGY